MDGYLICKSEYCRYYKSMCGINLHYFHVFMKKEPNPLRLKQYKFSTRQSIDYYNLIVCYIYEMHLYKEKASKNSYYFFLASYGNKCNDVPPS